jgi:flavin reductase (DIM6/NTAB) family NADH-FMN oxidoreductase RutF
VLQEVGRCGLSVLAAQHAIVASRFASAGRPSARHLLESVPWSRAPSSDAIVLDGGLAALDCRLDRLIEAGDHVLALLEIQDVVAVNTGAAPLLRLRGRFVDKSAGAPRRA